MAEPVLLDAKQLAKMLNIGVSTVWDMLKNNKIVRPIDVAGTKWHIEDINEWLNKKRKQSEHA
ncbi:MAG TPA: helix-turn-helix domain-containing protein [Aquella sp.]|nr:helix-turn-helix domain-containing protein [Aquella sp.]